jgi:hypothetical protein
MRIENLRSEKKGDRARVAATVSWEDCDRPTQEVYFETDEAFADSLSCNPHAFLVGCIVPAMHYGEERVFLDAEICPELREGLITAMSWLRHWYYDPDRQLVRIEAKTRSDLPTPRTPERAGFFFSGGIDSLATLRSNRLNFPLEHPGSIKDGLLVYGLEIDEPEAFEHVMSSLSKVARDAGVTLIPVYTNVRCLDDDWGFWEYEWQGAVFSAIAHAFSQRLTVVSVASSDDIPSLGLVNSKMFQPLGSHPLIDPNYSSSDLRIRHDGIALSRLDRARLVADWDVALQNIRVCNKSERYRSGMLNCGRCEKCVRTMLELLALGALDKTRAFPVDDVSEELVPARRLEPGEEYGVAIYYLELLPHLAERGRHDLVRAIEYRIAVYLDREPGWRGRIKRFDRKYLDGNLARFKRAILS